METKIRERLFRGKVICLFGPRRSGKTTLAKKILAERVKNSPKDRNEQKWLPGWQRRVESYLNVSKEK